MKIHIEQVDEGTNFTAKNERGHSVQLDDGSVTGGAFEGMSPMELLLSSVATCSSIDLVQILKKQRQPLENLQIEAEGIRPEDTTPRPFKKISLTFKLSGDLDESKVARAVELSVEKYCSVADTLDRDVEIIHDFEILDAQGA